MVLSRPLSELPDSARLAPSPVQASQHRSLPLVGWHRKGHSTGQQLQHRVSRADCQELHNYARGKLLSKRQLHRQLKCSAASATPTLPLPAQAPAADKSDTASLKPLPKNVENLADDPSIANPLQVSAFFCLVGSPACNAVVMLRVSIPLCMAGKVTHTCAATEARATWHGVDGRNHGVRWSSRGRHSRPALQGMAATSSGRGQAHASPLGHKEGRGYEE